MEMMISEAQINAKQTAEMNEWLNVVEQTFSRSSPLVCLKFIREVLSLTPTALEGNEL